LRRLIQRTKSRRRQKKQKGEGGYPGSRPKVYCHSTEEGRKRDFMFFVSMENPGRREKVVKKRVGGGKG